MSQSSQVAGQVAEPVATLAADIAARLRGVCGHLSDKQFSSLVADIARMSQRFADSEERGRGLARAAMHRDSANERSARAD